MKYRVKAKLLEITEWRKDDQQVAGDASHEGDAAVMRLVADEIEAKQEEHTYEPKGLPFEYEFDIEPECEEWVTEDEVKDRLLDEYAEEFCEYDYLKPSDCELEWEILKEYE